MAVGRLQHQHAVAGVLRFDCRLAGHLAAHRLAKKVTDPFESCGRIDIACHPLHRARLQGDVRLG